MAMVQKEAAALQSMDEIKIHPSNVLSTVQATHHHHDNTNRHNMPLFQ